jgi:hypothetical protein
MTNQTFSFITDTATMCIFDLLALKHRLRDTPDWWSIEREELAEMNGGNVAFVGLGSDGEFSVVNNEDGNFENPVTCHLNCPSGRIFVGAGEEVTSDGLEPECLRGGIFLVRPPGFYVVKVAGNGRKSIQLSIAPSRHGTNSFDSRLRL